MCVYLYVSVCDTVVHGHIIYACACVHIEAKGQHQVYSFITPFYFLSQFPPLNLELTNIVGLAG